MKARGAAPPTPSPAPWWAEAPLVLVNLVVVAGFARVFEPGGWLRPLLAVTLFGHACAIAVRRAGWRGTASTAVAVVGWPLAVGWFLFADTLRWGLPTQATVDAASDALDRARLAYPVVVAPTEALPGFLLVASFGLWMAIWFGDWTAHRVRASAEAVATSGAIFVFCAILGSGRHQIASAAAFSAAVLVFVAVQRATAIEREQRWLPSSPATARAVLGGAAMVTALAVGLGALVGPSLPGAGQEPAFDWRGGDGGGSRVTVSPMVELKKRLVEQSDRQLFEVRATQRSYWRLTSLDRFDGQIWSSSGDFDAADEQLPSNVPPGLAASTITQTVRIQALSAIWAPSAFEATSVRRTTEDLRWDPDSGTLIVASSRPTTDGMRYTIVSRSPAFAPDELRAADGPDPTTVVERYTGLPADFPALAARSARDVTVDAETRYDQAIALQDWFRTAFTYSLDSPAGHSDDALVDFLESGTGYCEQFAGAFAAMARSLGMPARVAVGFTPGIQDPTDPERYRVQGRHAHAWPEVYFPGSGWVAFEPTPGRGIPGAEAHTGVAAAQDDTAGAPVPTSTTTAPTTSRETSTDQTTAPAASEPSRTTTTSGADGPAARSAPARWWIPALAAVALLVAVAARKRRQDRSVPIGGEVEQAWAQVSGHLRRLGMLDEVPGDTPLEVAGRSAGGLGDAGGQLIELADLVTESRWSPEQLRDAQVERVADLRRQLTSVQARPESSSASS